MKKLLFIISTFVFSVFSLFAQSDYISYSGQGKVVLTDGTEVTGKVVFWIYTPARVHVTPEGAKDDTKYKSDDVKEFTIEDKVYASIELKGGISVGNNKVFALLLTSPDAKLKVFKVETQPTVSTGGSVPVTTSYYAMIPGETAAYGLSEMKFNPAKKLAKILADCPALAEKINSKTENYFYPMITTDEFRLKIFLNLSEEYQKCK